MHLLFRAGISHFQRMFWCEALWNVEGIRWLIPGIA